MRAANDTVLSSLQPNHLEGRKISSRECSPRIFRSAYIITLSLLAALMTTSNSTMRRRVLGWTVLLIAICVAVNILINHKRRRALATTSEQPPTVVQAVLPEQVHLSFGSSQSEMIVTWSTNDSTSSVVEYGVSQLDQRATGGSTLFINEGPLRREMYIHRVLIRGLPDVKQLYQYRCGSPAGWSAIFTFRTPSSSSNWSPRLAIFGDLGFENARSIPFLIRESKQLQYDAVIHLGDIAYFLGSEDGLVGDKFMQMIEPIAAHIPYMTCPGNHDKAYMFSQYINRFSMMGMDGNINNHYYSWNIGPAHIISFSTEFYFNREYGLKWIAKQYKWLKEDLETANKPGNRKARPWIITTGHRPLYCATTLGECTKKPNRLRNGMKGTQEYGLEDLFKTHKVDVAFGAHKHIYERWWPLYKGQVYNGSLAAPYTNPKAPVYITSGVGGSVFNQDFLVEDHSWAAFRSTEFGFTRLNILNKTHLHLQQIAVDKDGKVVDEMMLVKNHREDAVDKNEPL